MRQGVADAARRAYPSSGSRPSDPIPPRHRAGTCAGRIRSNDPEFKGFCFFSEFFDAENSDSSVSEPEATLS